MNHYQTILDDLMNGLPVEVNEYPVPYEEWMTFENKIKMTRKALSRAKNINNRLLQLVNAFYLGRLLEVEADSNDQREQYANQLTLHYRTVARRTYYLFEVPGVKQIMRTTKTTLTTIRTISSAEYEDLLQHSLNNFNGVEILAESDVM